MSRPCTRCGKDKGGIAHVCDPSLIYTDNDGKDHDVTEFSERLATIMENMGGSDTDPADWMDTFGCCKICGGEIPHGHQGNCYVYTQEKEVKALNERVEFLEGELKFWAKEARGGFDEDE